MRVIGMMRIRNEARWIGEVLDALRPICQRVVVMDDHSDDGTPDICRERGAEVLPSPFANLDEGRDKNWLLAQVAQHGRPDWIIHVDGDEILEDGAADHLLPIMERPEVDSIRMRVIYLWDTREQVRMDGIYSRFRRGSAFRYRPGAVFRNGFHCSNVPAIGWAPVMRDSEARLLHLGYLHREDRIRKYHWYNSKDPNNRSEDCYRHMVLGDLPEFPETMRCKHAGPLKLAPLHVEVLA